MVSLDKVVLSSPQYMGRDFKHGSHWRWWTATWPLPAYESEDEWQQAVDERAIGDRIVEEFDQRASFSAEVRERLLVVQVSLICDPMDTDADEHLDDQAAELFGIVQGLIYEDSDW